jgi:origin recognition complex subunit 1
VEVNGLQMPRPDVAYSVLWKALQPPQEEDEDDEEHKLQPSRLSMSAARLCEILQREFHTKSAKRPMLLVLLDEMDFMLAGKNQVLYNLLEWQTSASAKLVLVGIANTMDLPERLPTKIRSRLGGHRITFPAYTRAQLENIIQQRLLQLDIFSEEAIQICAKSLAHQSGDVRQALSLCRKSAEVCLHRLSTLDGNAAGNDDGGELLVTAEDLHEAQQAVSVSAPMSRLRACSNFECTFLVALRMEVRTTQLVGSTRAVQSWKLSSSALRFCARRTRSCQFRVCEDSSSSATSSSAPQSSGRSRHARRVTRCWSCGARIRSFRTCSLRTRSTCS